MGEKEIEREGKLERESDKHSGRLVADSTIVSQPCYLTDKMKFAAELSTILPQMIMEVPAD